jgi:hypothetical protein
MSTKKQIHIHNRRIIIAKTSLSFSHYWKPRLTLLLPISPFSTVQHGVEVCLSLRAVAGAQRWWMREWHGSRERIERALGKVPEKGGEAAIVLTLLRRTRGNAPSL